MKSIIAFSKRQIVTWYMGDREVGESTFISNDELYAEILCKEENMPRHQRDPIYIYTVRNLRGQTGVIFAYLDQPLKIRDANENDTNYEPSKAA